MNTFKDKEIDMNNQSRLMAMILNIRLAAGTDQQQRCSASLIAEQETIPHLQGGRQDNKTNCDPVKEPPNRSLPSAINFPTTLLFNMSSKSNQINRRQHG